MPYDEEKLSLIGLTQTEKRVAVCMFNGMSHAGTAKALEMSEHTVKAHARSICRKAEVKNQKMFMAKYLM